MVESRAFSAPGKALLVGGYLVLDPKYKSYVVALSARMHGVVSKHESEDNHTRVTVTSSQFNNDSWSYIVEENNAFFPNSVDGKRNPFIEMAIFNVFTYFKPDLSNKLDIQIEIFSDSGYHSQAGSVLKRNSFKEFSYHSHSITEVPKTGLGSSAGLATVVTAALVSVFNPNLDVNRDQDLTLIHNLAQVAHCQAQGKVGSGFDVAAATFGSIMYQRFDPRLITDLPEHSAGQIYGQQLRSLVNQVDWKVTIERVRLPDQLRLVMGDVNSGSETTKLVAKVISWYNANLPRSLDVYEELNCLNEEFIKTLGVLNSLAAKDPNRYAQMMEALNGGGYKRIMAFSELAKLRNCINCIRENFRLITKESGADIEPSVQTELLDACMWLDGVLTAVLPGAGGYDAISLITTKDADIRSQTEGNSAFDAVTWLDLSQADIGLVEENPIHYQDLK
ncbi:hypothetical protein HG536_0D01710 [Torulaspora globosa]|uniref:Phosphomevalonate kinase n=1 Tax=Torulaspora globosa TaxID=48254 RepID=A0A7G3ZGL3_9SACH|nr:uncharacterized protein HG536_0D01710 [Torulaspora globosa]QLL32649.1 hypothetical protein HG536_0D01710 [Torulaspora globosa]